MFHGVAQESGKGVPSCIFQNKDTSEISHAKARWNLKVATLKVYPSIPGIAALSLYDSKPFYFISNACEVVKWNNMTRRVRSKEKNRMVEMPFFRFESDPRLQHWNECYIFSIPNKKYLLLGYIYAQEEAVVVNSDVVFTDAT